MQFTFPCFDYFNVIRMISLNLLSHFDYTVCHLWGAAEIVNHVTPKEQTIRNRKHREKSNSSEWVYWENSRQTSHHFLWHSLDVFAFLIVDCLFPSFLTHIDHNETMAAIIRWQNKQSYCSSTSQNTASSTFGINHTRYCVRKGGCRGKRTHRGKRNDQGERSYRW